MADFLLPDLGEGLSEAEVIAWRVSPGDRVSVDQVIAEVETAKAVVEVPVPYAGVVAALHATPGSVVSVGQPLITVTEDAAVTGGAAGGGAAGSGAAGGGPGGFREPGVVVPEQVPAAADGGEVDGVEEASGSVLIGYGTTVAQARPRRGRRRGAAGAPTAASALSAPPAPSIPSAPPTPPARPEPLATLAPSAVSGLAAAGQPRRVAVVSPLARKEARDAGVDLAGLTGTGPDGVVSRQDIREAIAERTMQQRAATPDAGSSAGTAVASMVEGTDTDTDVRVRVRVRVRA